MSPKLRHPSLDLLLIGKLNGGLAGSGVGVLSRPGRKITVTGIDNHDLTCLDILTCAGLVDTNHGRVILIMNEYAYFGQCSSIHSPGQIEWYKNTCDDKSVKVGGNQKIEFLDGYALPLECKWSYVDQDAWSTN
ncbi:hypothetical protein ACA910_004450 [Epithemia clementina (nom. ined.)]